MLTPNVTLGGKTVLVTGSAGFIGANLVRRLLTSEKGIHVVGVDSLNDYYDPALKDYRLRELAALAEPMKGNSYGRYMLELVERARR